MGKHVVQLVNTNKNNEGTLFCVVQYDPDSRRDSQVTMRSVIHGWGSEKQGTMLHPPMGVHTVVS